MSLLKYYQKLDDAVAYLLSTISEKKLLIDNNLKIKKLFCRYRYVM